MNAEALAPDGQVRLLCRRDDLMLVDGRSTTRPAEAVSEDGGREASG